MIQHIILKQELYVQIISITFFNKDMCVYIFRQTLRL